MSSTRKYPTRKPASPKIPLTPSSAMLERMEMKMEELRDSIIQQLTTVMVTSEERVMQKIGEIAAEMANVKLRMAEIEKRVTAVENGCKDVLALRTELASAQAQLSALESSAVSTDVIINGIQPAADECLPDLFAKICDAAQHKSPPLRDAFRLRSAKGNGQKSSNNCPIVVKLFSAHDRNQLLKSIALFRKSKKRSLALSDVGLPGYGSIVVHESLPKMLREVMSYASELRRKKQLASAFSIRGKIFVRLKLNEEPKLVCSITEVQNLISTKTQTI